jgi:hypothetical protein
MFILDIEPFFHRAVRGPETVALMRSIGHQQIKVGLRGRPVAHFRIHESAATTMPAAACRRTASGQVRPESSSGLKVAASATKEQSGQVPPRCPLTFRIALIGQLELAHSGVCSVAGQHERVAPQAGFALDGVVLK